MIKRSIRKILPLLCFFSAVAILASCSGEPGADDSNNPVIAVRESTIGDIVFIDDTVGVIAYKADSPEEWGEYILAEEYDLPHYEKLLETGAGTPGEPYYGRFWDHNIPEFGDVLLKIGAEGRTIGSGQENTEMILAVLGDESNQNLWGYVRQHREKTSNNWFVPSSDELLQIKKNRALIDNFTVAENETGIYWTSTEISDDDVAAIAFYDDSETYLEKHKNSMLRVRLCRYADSDDIGRSIVLSCGIEGYEIRYTTDGTNPTASSSLYYRPFVIPAGTEIIKAAAYAESKRVSGIVEMDAAFLASD